MSSFINKYITQINLKSILDIKHYRALLKNNYFISNKFSLSFINYSSNILKKYKSLLKSN